MKKLVVLTISLTLFLSAVPAHVLAENVSVRATVPSRLVLVLDSSTVDFGNVDLDYGLVVTNALQASVLSNVPWDLHVQAVDDFVGERSGTVLPASRLEWRVSPEIPFRPVAVAGNLVADDHPRGRAQIFFDYRIHLGYDAPPDTYKTSLLFTLVPAY